MKRISYFFIAVICSLITISTVHAQTTTYILVRHAEKDTMRNDPPLTAAGQLRAQKLVEVLKNYSPDIIYSTNYTRTKSTVTPLAQKYGKEIQLYDPRKLDAFATELLNQQGKTIVVAGHSNTSPALANLLIKEKTYADLDESIYNQFWIVTVVDGKATAKTITY